MSGVSMLLWTTCGVLLRNVTMRKSPLVPLSQSGEFEMGMRGKIETRAKDDNLVQAYQGHYLVFQCLNDQTEFSK
jgi:hypothetical protein